MEDDVMFMESVYSSVRVTSGVLDARSSRILKEYTMLEETTLLKKSAFE